MTDRNLLAWLLDAGYTDLQTMSDGKVCGLHKMLYTTALCVGMDRGGYQRRYCYEKESDARKALAMWDGIDDPEGPWIKEKSSDRLGPGATK